jgi:hypothetical protein
MNKRVRAVSVVAACLIQSPPYVVPADKKWDENAQLIAAVRNARDPAAFGSLLFDKITGDALIDPEMDDSLPPPDAPRVALNCTRNRALCATRTLRPSLRRVTTG